MVDEKKVVKLPHNLILEDRRALSVSGVADIDSFDEQSVVLFTDLGELTIKGYNLHINKLNVDTGELTLEGEIYALSYADEQPQKGGGFFSKIFK
ncbi:sporulation protein YabP [Zongyangia hominis]|uniref:Sporulation protein YabP n=1 Tax=Zongyangia hominis TaxID=2763677 RepID=A0A926E9R2_9FIRM|nr:sporulation protein YabP [Zongyangia hominis]MBC8569803.1 sporulation protein YabP [Zongyangia hominis]